MEIEVEINDRYTLVTLTADAINENANAQLLAQVHPLIAEAARPVLVDLSRPRYMNSAGISALVNLKARANMVGCRLLFVVPGPFIAGIFAKTRLDQFFELADDLAEAESRLKAG